MNPRSFACALMLALAVTLASTVVQGRSRVTYPDIMGCEDGCDVAASGFPVSFIIDYPGLSPVGGADLAGALLGVDRVHWPRAAATFTVWLSVTGAVVYLIGRKRDLCNIHGTRRE